MENTLREEDSTILRKVDDGLKLGLEMTQSMEGLSSWQKKKNRKRQNRRYNYLKGNYIYDNLPKATSSINNTLHIDPFPQNPVNTCLSAYLDVAQSYAEVVISEDMDKGKGPIRNALTCNDINQNLQESGTQPGHSLSTTEYAERENDNCVSVVAEQLDSFPICVETSSIREHDYDVEVDIGSPEVSSIKIYQRKKQIKTYKRKRELSDSEISCLGFSEDDDAPASGFSEDMLGEEVAGFGTSLLVARDISVGRDSGESPGVVLESEEQKKKIKMETLQEIVNEQFVVKDVSEADPSGKDLQWGNSDKLNVIHDAVEHVYAVEERFDNSKAFYEDKVSDDVNGSNPSVDKLGPDHLETHSKIKNLISSSSQSGAMIDEVSLSVVSKDVPQKMLQSSLGAATEENRKKLLVLDVNGLLADIVSYVPEQYKPDTTISRKAVFKRPFCDDFLQFCFESFSVGVWSSRNKKNVDSVLDFLMGKFKSNLLFCWDQSHCTDTGFMTVENKDKPLVLKELKKLWEKHEPGLPWERGQYNESNTLLLDDSPYKALRNPPHTAIFPHTYRYKAVKDNSLGPGGDLRVYLEGLASADNVQKYVELNPFGQRPITKANLSWAFYLKVIGTTSSQEEEGTNNSSMGCSGAVDPELAPNGLPLPMSAPNGQAIGCDGQLLVDAPKPNSQATGFDDRLPLPANAPNGDGVGFNGQPLVNERNPNFQGKGFDGCLPVTPRQPCGTSPLPPNASSTLFVEGLPPDSTRREVAHIFRPFVGYNQVRLVRKESTRYWYGDYHPRILCFVEFADAACAATALRSLQGYKVDEDDPHPAYLRLQFSNSRGPRSGGLGSQWKR